MTQHGFQQHEGGHVVSSNTHNPSVGFFQNGMIKFTLHERVQIIQLDTEFLSSGRLFMESVQGMNGAIFLYFFGRRQDSLATTEVFSGSQMETKATFRINQLFFCHMQSASATYRKLERLMMKYEVKCNRCGRCEEALHVRRKSSPIVSGE
ncbi:hypothetical protein AVEN_264796-1 [Araneus ventricosus]|uniref:Uncharacterized protein n=1 Tax=Araneus ventricosus TaxID=182803 RepID=A0A4Y2TUM6_ARAVE|nr:hypothetical protein AVEN_264796-1 [Araneus ventricosus]